MASFASLRRLLAPFLLSLLALGVAGCPTIPKNGAVLAGKLTEGIQKNQAETEKIIKAFADTERAILNEKWDDMYAQTEKGWMEKNGVADAKNLTQDQRRKIAATASKARTDILDAIAVKEADLVARSRANTAQLVDISSTLQKYLLSLENLDAANTAVTKKISEITGVDLSGLRGLVETQLKNLNP